MKFYVKFPLDAYAMQFYPEIESMEGLKQAIRDFINKDRIPENIEYWINKN